MKILVVAPFYKPAYIYGGPVRSVSALCEGMARAGAQVQVLTTDANGRGQRLPSATDRPMMVDGVEVFYLPHAPVPLMPLFFYSPALGRACREMMGQFDAAYLAINWNHPTMSAAQAAMRAGVPYVFSPRGCFMNWAMQQLWWQKRLYLALIERRLMDHAAAIHCTGAMEEAQLRAWHFRPPTFVVPNGLDMAPFRRLPARGELRQSLGIPLAATVSLLVGRLHKMKRVGHTVQVFAEVARTLPGAHLVIAGPDEDGSGQAAQELARTLGVSERVHFAGLLTGGALLQAYADANLLVLLSHRENFGMVVAEGMAAGLPVLISDQVGLAEEVKQAEAGRVAADDEHEAAQTWQALLTLPNLRAMGARGQTLVSTHFDSEIVAAQMRNALTRIAAQAHRLGNVG